jgi:hypothetical protein
VLLLGELLLLPPHLLVAVDAEPVGVVHAFGVGTILGHRGTTVGMVAVVAHAASVVLPVSVLAPGDHVFLLALIALELIIL